MLKTKNGYRLPNILSTVLSCGSILLLCGTLFFTNTGCEIVEKLMSFQVLLNPPYFLVTHPGQTGVVKATLMWNAEGAERELEAKTWTVVGGLPDPVQSVDWSPKVNSVYTDLTITCSSDPKDFGPSDQWVASGTSAFVIGVKANFPEPVWLSMEKQEVNISRTAYLPLRMGNPQVVVSVVNAGGDDRSRYVQANIRTENPLEGWRYSVRVYPKIFNRVTGESIAMASEQIDYEGAGGFNFPNGPFILQSPDPDEAEYLVCEISYRSADGSSVRNETKALKVM